MVTELRRRLPHRPLVGITGPRIHAAEIRSTPPILWHAFMDTYFAHYAEAVTRAGALAVQLPRDNDPEELVARLDGVVIGGGQDVDPRLYGSQPTAASTRIDPVRDAFEIRLILAALDQRIPLLAVCRGAQLLNVALGGTLLEVAAESQLIEHAVVVYPPNAQVHAVEFEPGTLLAGVYGDRISVNSFHHQGIGRLGEGVCASGRAPDGMIEAIEIPGAPAVGVQWHPEMLDDADPVLDWLVENAALPHSQADQGVA
jgi:putative glutamine amidotransferase